MKKFGVLSALFLSLSLAFTTGCRKDGPAENAGEKMDDAGDAVKDAVTPDGPAEKAGDKVDDALD